MRKYILSLLIIISILINIDVFALSKSELTILHLDPITTIEKPSGFTSVQGGTTTDKFIITLFIDESNNKSNTAILVLNKKNYKLVRLVKNPIKEYNFNHANDATYNSNTNELLVLSGRRIAFLDLTDNKFELKREVKLKKYYHGLGYDEEKDEYVLSRTIKNGTLFEIRDNEFNIKKTFKLKTNLTKQSLTVYKGNIYYVCYEAGRINKYQSVYDGLLKRKENLIYVYDLNGKRKNIYYIPYSYKEIIFGEIENISFNNDKMLIQFNHSSKAGYFTAEFDENVELKTNIKTSSVKKNKEFSLSESDSELIKIKEENKSIPINISYDKEGVYTYHIESTKSIEEIPYQDALEDLEVNVYYDPVINKLKVKSNSDELIIYKDNLYSKNKLKELKDPTLVEVPDTNSNNNIKIIGVIILILGLVFIKKNRINKRTF